MKKKKTTIIEKNGRYIKMKILWILLALVFIIFTLGIIDVEMNFTDGSFFRYRGLISRLSAFIGR